MGFDFSVVSAGLARSAGVLAAAPTPLPGPGAFQAWVLERPLAPAVLLLVVGVVLWFILRGQGKEKEGRRAALALGVLGVGVFAAGTLVETTNEKLSARARELVAAVATVNSTQVDGFLASDAIAMPWGFSREVIMRRLEADLGRAFPIKEHAVQQVRAKVDGPNLARTQLRVRVVVDSPLYNIPNSSWWMVSWRKEAATGEWKVIQIEAQQIDGVGDVSNITG